MQLQSGDDTSDPPGSVRLLLDSVHPQLPFAFVRRQSLRVGVCQGMEQLEDENHFPSGENLLARGSDPRHSVGQHRHHLGLEQAVPANDLPQASAELRDPADNARRTRAVDAGADRAVMLADQGKVLRLLLVRQTLQNADNQTASESTKQISPENINRTQRDCN